jgi:two-component system LytT family response regulator
VKREIEGTVGSMPGTSGDRSPRSLPAGSPVQPALPSVTFARTFRISDEEGRVTATQRATLKIRALIVDDEPLARERIRTLLAEEPDVEIVGECSDGREAVDAIRRLEPDLVFLDVQMAEMDGFAVLDEIGPEHIPAVIFVTAYDRHALRAFEVHALDFLLKPFDRERFGRALQRIKDHLQYASPGVLNRRILSLLEDLKRPQPGYVERLALKTGGRVSFIKADEIDWIEGEGNYARLHVAKQSHLIRETMNQLEARLDPARFLRIHRSTIVNTERIKEIQPLFNGAYGVLLKDGTRLTLSRGYRERLKVLTGEEV